MVNGSSVLRLDKTNAHTRVHAIMYLFIYAFMINELHFALPFWFFALLPARNPQCFAAARCRPQSRRLLASVCSETAVAAQCQMAKVTGHNKNKEVVARARTHIEFANKEFACTDAENQLEPMCKSQAKETFGAWTPVQILSDHIAMEAGFSKSAFQAQCVTYDGVRYVHVKKGSPWFIAAVGGPQCKKGNMPAVQVIDQLCAKIFGNNYTTVGAEDQDRSRGEDGEHDEDVEREPDDAGEEIDPMSQLTACVPEAELQTPKKSNMRKPRLPKRPSSLVREIDMPKRPQCVAGAAGGGHKVHVFVKPNTKALYLRMDCVDWLISYAADEHYYQGVRRCDVAPSEDKDYEIDYDFNDKAYEGKINVGVNAGRTTRMSMHQLTKELFEKIADKLDGTRFDQGMGYWSKATPKLKRRACREFVESWCKAAVEGSLQEFIDEYSGVCNVSAKRRKMVTETAVAASQPGTPGGASQQEGQTAVAESQQEIVCAAASHEDSQASTAVPQSQPVTADADAVEDSQLDFSQVEGSQLDFSAVEDSQLDFSAS